MPVILPPGRAREATTPCGHRRCSNSSTLIFRGTQLVWSSGMADSDAGSAQLLRFDDRTMMYEGDAKDWEAQVHWHGDQLRRWTHSAT